MKSKTTIDSLRLLPSVDKVIHSSQLADSVEIYGRPLVTYAVRTVLSNLRAAQGKKKAPAAIDENAIFNDVIGLITTIGQPTLKPVINATGIVLHTNLGRAPMSEEMFKEILPTVTGYTNIEFDLKKAKRGHRIDHIAGLLRYLTGAQDALVVNNNAAAIVLTLNTLANQREVVISRSELIEIGGAFRIPDIMAAAGVKMIEVGTTNRTRLKDYQKAITPNTALIVKAHTSNYSITGFTEEVSIRELAGLGRSKKIPFLYDIGSGLLRKPEGLPLDQEPDVQSAIAAGADLVCFSADKLLGGPQAGIIAGKTKYLRALAEAPMMRALRVGKLTLAALSGACRLYLDDQSLKKNNPIFSLLERTDDQRKRIAELLLAALTAHGINAEIIASEGRCGGGTLPNLTVDSLAVRLIPQAKTVRERESEAAKLHRSLLIANQPVLSVLREGRILFDVFTLRESEIGTIAENVALFMKNSTTV